MITLKITQEGTLLPTLLTVSNLTPAQVSIITAIVKAPDLTYGEVLRFLADRIPENQPHTEHVTRYPA